jgi:exportin-7
LASLDDIQASVIGIVRDLRGLCSAFVSKQAYSSLFDWLYPSYLPLFLKALYVFYDRSDVYNPLLKLFHELTSNRQERLAFDSTKPSAYLLFRETSNLLYIFQTKTIVHVNTTIPETDGILFYKAKLKPIITCLRIIRACLIGRITIRKKKKSFLKNLILGNYVNFGVFHLYSDPCFDNCLQVFLSILTSVKQKDLLSYPKLTLAYFTLIETLSLVQIDFLANLNTPLFGYVLETISEGFLSPEQTIQNSCCIFLDTFLSYVFRSVKKNTAPASLMANVNEYGNLFRQILVNLLNGIIFAECK